jgi:putative ABC transport system ATP-binding protein
VTTIRLERLSRCFEGSRRSGPTWVLREVDLTLKPGEGVAMLGRSGSGKSTLLSLIGLLDAPTGGSYFLDQQRVVHGDRRRIAQLRGELFGFVFQQFCVMPQLTAFENVETALIHARSPRRGRRALVMNALDQVGLASRADQRSGHLSGGEKQRVAIARAMVRRPRVLLADEPTGSLDEETGAQVMECIGGLVSELGATFVCITHDPQLASTFDRVLHVGRGQVLEHAPG